MFLLVAALLLPARTYANVYDIDLFHISSSIQTSGMFSGLFLGLDSPVSGGFITPIFHFAPGDEVNFGTLTVHPGFHPNGHVGIQSIEETIPDLYVSFDPLITPQANPFDLVGCSFEENHPPCFPPLLPSRTFSLDFTIPDDASTIQFAWNGPADYLAPNVPEPSTWAMLLIGFAAIGFASRFRAPGLAGRGNVG